MKDEILKTALEQFSKYGIREMSIQKLIAPLGISTKTVYKYYKNKEELLENVLLYYYDGQFKQMENLTSGQNAVHLFYEVWYIALENSVKTNTIFFKDLNYYYPELEYKIERTIASKFSEKFLEIIRKGKNDDVFRQEIIPEIILEGIYIFYEAIVRKGRFNRFSKTTYEIFQNTITAYIRGICTPGGIRELDEFIKTHRLSLPEIILNTNDSDNNK